MNCLRPHAPPSLPRPLLGRLVLFGGTSTSTSTSTSVNTGVGRGGALCTPAAAAAAAAATLGVRHISKKAKEKAKKLEAAQKCAPPPGHGERFWVFNHIEANYVVYSMTPEMRNKVFRQFPFTGKKLVPSKLRKDYWRKMAVVEFGEGKGEIGRSVFQKLLELKKRHALEWDDERLLRMPKRERGRELNDQRGNAVADLAAVLAGRGKGNKMVVCKRWPLLGEQQQQQQQQQQKGQDGQEVAKEGGEGKQEAPRPKLQTATIYWANEQDKFYAESWTDNVTHVVGLPENTGKDEQPAEAEPAETEPAKESGGEAAAAQAT